MHVDPEPGCRPARGPDCGPDPGDLWLLHLVAQGHKAAAVSRMTGRSERGVRRRIRLMLDHTGCRSVPHLVAWAVRHGYIDPEVPGPVAACGRLDVPEDWPHNTVISQR